MKLVINGQQLAATHSLSQILDVLDGHGLRHIELWPQNIPGGGTPEEDERYETRDVASAARLLAERGIEVACVTLGYWAAPLCFAAGGAQRYTEALKGAVDTARTLKAKLVNTYNVGIPLSLWADAAAPAADYAARHGIVITLENEAHDESGLPANVAEVCRRVDSPSLRVLFDPCNYLHAGVEPFPHAYDVLKPHIGYVHLKGGCLYRPGQAGVHKGSTLRESTRDFIGYLPLPQAAYNVQGVVHALKRDGYQGFVALEPHVRPSDVLAFYEEEIPFVRALLGE